MNTASMRKPTLCKALNRKKPVQKSILQTSTTKTLRWYDLTAYGIAATVGSGIYATCGRVATKTAGPAVIASTGIAGLLSLFTGICYLEFASSLPISGSSYAYFYTTLGEFSGWFMGWNLTLEYAFAAAAISGAWSEYFVSFLNDMGISIPKVLYNIPLTSGSESAFRLNMIAAIVCLLIGTIVSRGIKFGAVFTNFITALNIGIILFIVAVGSFSVRTENWAPFAPFGVTGIFSGAGDMFFSYIGYDTISSLAGDAINPARDLPIAVFLTIATATVLYMGVGLVLTGMQSYLDLDQSSPLAEALASVGHPWASYIVSVCALMTMAATIFACLMGQPKIFQAIAKDGLMPKVFARENSAGTPLGGVAFSTILTALLALFLDVNNGLIEMISFGTLLGMSVLCAGLLVVRFQQHPPIKRFGIIMTILYFIATVLTSLAYQLSSSYALYTSLSMLFPFLVLVYLFIAYSNELASNSLAFICPLMPLLPCLAIAANTFMMLQMNSIALSFAQFCIWTAIGLVIYFGYGIRHSHLIQDEEK